MLLLDPDVELRPDEAAVRMGTLREVHGAANVAGALAGGAQRRASRSSTAWLRWSGRRAADARRDRVRVATIGSSPST